MNGLKNALDKIKIASPCSANWNEMIGDNRKRHCAECKLNVYNLSDMTKSEAESFLINSEGRVCLRVYRRKDGSVITRDCPVGFAKLKRKVSRAATAVLASLIGLFTGLFSFYQTEVNLPDLDNHIVVENDDPIVEESPLPIAGKPTNLDEIRSEIDKSQKKKVLMGRLIIKRK